MRDVDQSSDIAIIGMSGRFPQARNVDEFWRFIAAGLDALREYSAEEIAQAQLDQALVRDPTYVSAGYNLDHINLFDAEFFGFSPAEARILDPQHRLFLECVWEALESAGYISKTDKLRVGLYAGASSSTYMETNLSPNLDFTRRPTYYLQALTSTDKDYLTTRISYKLNLKGPSIGIQTACSTSLVAVSLACQSLLDYQCDVALAGGVTIRHGGRGRLGYLYEQGGILSLDGHCRPFDAQATGTIFGNGAGVVVLRRLEDAIADRDAILAVIKDSAVNNDGSMKVGYTAPSVQGQAEVIAAAQAMADVSPESITYIEAHGSGTPLGDPIEIEALTRAFRVHTSKKGFCAIGSVKSNVGHLESAAGVAGLIKTTLALLHKQIPPSLHFNAPNPQIDFVSSPFYVNTKLSEWKTDGKTPRRAGVSSFGMGGTNTHVIMEEAPETQKLSNDFDRPVHLLTLSAKSEIALRELAGRYVEFLKPEMDAASVCFMSNTGRRHFSYRLAVCGKDTTDLRERLEAYLGGEKSAGLVAGKVGEEPIRPPAFLFTGHSSQYERKGKELFDSHPVFRRVILRCEEILRRDSKESLIEELYSSSGENAVADKAARALLAQFALQCALAELWKSWGISPWAVMGYGAGEYAAAYAAGVFSLEDGLKLVTAAGRLMRSSPADAVDEFRRVASDVSYATPKARFISCFTGEEVDSSIATPEYWTRHALEPVRTLDAIQALYQTGVRLFLEIGPEPTLLGLACECLPEDSGLLIPSLRIGIREWEQILESLSQLYVAGAAVDWEGYDKEYSRQRIIQPTYPFQGKPYWVDQPEIEHRMTALQPSGDSEIHPLLGHRMRLAGSQEVRFESRVSAVRPTFLNDHRIFNEAVMPASAYVEMGLAAGALVSSGDSLVLEDLFIQKALILPAGEQKILQTVLSEETARGHLFKIYSLDSNGGEAEPAWTLHATGRIQATGDDSLPAKADLSLLKAQMLEPVDVSGYYRRFSELQAQYGKNFQAISRLWRSMGESGQSLAEIRLPEQLEGDLAQYRLHPVLLDCCLQAVAAALPDSDNQVTYLPVGFRRLKVFRRPTGTLWSLASARLGAQNHTPQLSIDLGLFDRDGEPVATLEGLSVLPASSRALLPDQRKAFAQWLHYIEWQAQDRPQEKPRPSSGEAANWLIFADRGGLGEKLANLLRACQQHCDMIYAGSGYEHTKEDSFNIDPEMPDDLRRLISEDMSEKMQMCRGVIYLWSLDNPARGEQETHEPSLTALRQRQSLSCGGALHLAQSLIEVNWKRPPSVFLVTRAAQSTGGEAIPLNVAQATVWGLGRAAAVERPELRFKCIDLDPSAPPDEARELLEEVLSDSAENQIAFRQSGRMVARLVPPGVRNEAHQDCLDLPSSESFRLQLSDYGILENLTLIPTPRPNPGPGQVEIQVKAAGLNFRDVLQVLGVMRNVNGGSAISAPDMPLGVECSGTVVALGQAVSGFEIGDDVIALAPNSLASNIAVRAEFVFPKPQNLTFEEAATIPVAFLTAHYGLNHLAKLKQHESVLLHAAAGGVGQAAVQLARRIGARVFATASSAKWEFLKATGVDNVMNSRSLEFADQIKDLTQGNGVDVVLNSLNGESIARSFESLDKGGRFVEIGKIGVWDQQQANQLRPDVSYSIFDLDQEARRDSALLASTFKRIIQDFEQGLLLPLPAEVFSIQDVISAFRHMAQGRHVGKVVISLDGKEVTRQRSTGTPVRADGCYLITGGLGALGLKVAGWLASQGARRLVLCGRSLPADDKRHRLEAFERVGTQVVIAQADISSEEEVERLIRDNHSPDVPLRGVFHAAGVYEDALLAKQSMESFRRVLAPKADGAWNLHQATRSIPLDFFVCFSSLSSILGSAGQSNYAAANAFLDAIAHYRRALGLPALSINWGPWAESGMAASVGVRAMSRRVAWGISDIPPEQGVQALEYLLKETASVQVGVLPIEWGKFLRQMPVEVPFFETLHREAGLERQSMLQKQLQDAPAKDRRQILASYVTAQIAKSLGLSRAEEIGPRQRFFDLGIDSLMSIELRNRLENALGRHLPQTLILDYPTLEALIEYLEGEVLGLKQEKPGTSAEATAPEADEEVDTLLLEIGDMSDSEIKNKLRRNRSALS